MKVERSMIFANVELADANVLDDGVEEEVATGGPGKESMEESVIQPKGRTAREKKIE